jgi:hypothetical protein
VSVSGFDESSLRFDFSIMRQADELHDDSPSAAKHLAHDEVQNNYVRASSSNTV